MEQTEEYLQITSLPNELLSLILLNNSCSDILNFGLTCKHFYGFITDNQYLWKEKFKITLPHYIYDTVKKCGRGEWLKEYKRYCEMKQKVRTVLISMPPKLYWQFNEVSLHDVKEFFSMALSSNIDYCYVIFILQDLIRKGNESLELNCSEPPYTLTVMYYAKIAVRYLTQTYLAIKWCQYHMKSELSPKIVLNFFVQWTDAANIHKDEDVDATVVELVQEVEQLFPSNEATQPKPSLSEKVTRGLIKQRDVLLAISEIIYQKHHMALMPNANLETLDIVKIFKFKCGHPISVATAYQAVAERCGVRCELIAFPNHLYLEWSDQSRGRYNIDLATGTIVAKSGCPYSRGLIRNDIRYCPDRFIQYIIDTFLYTARRIKNWSITSARYLQAFLTADPSNENPYKGYQEYLMHCDRLSAITATLKAEFMDDNYLKMLEHLVQITPSPVPVKRALTVNLRSNGLLFAVGMICYHTVYEYFCVVLDWDVACSMDVGMPRPEMDQLRFGYNQPFYRVIAVDQSERYIAQENLLDVARPNRLYHLEDLIAKHFTHFDGYCYIPNREKEMEYPGDGPIRAVFKQKNYLRSYVD